MYLLCVFGTLRLHHLEVSMAKQCHMTIFWPASLLGTLAREVGILHLWKESRSHQLVVTEWESRGHSAWPAAGSSPQFLPRAPALGSSNRLASLPPRISLYP